MTRSREGFWGFILETSCYGHETANQKAVKRFRQGAVGYERALGGRTKAREVLKGYYRDGLGVSGRREVSRVDFVKEPITLGETIYPRRVFDGGDKKLEEIAPETFRAILDKGLRNY